MKNKIKNKIKSIPLIGWFVRWLYNLLRLNNLKHNFLVYQAKTLERYMQQKEELAKQKEELAKQSRQLEEYGKIHKNTQQLMYELVRKEIQSQSILFHHKIDNLMKDSDNLPILKQNIAKNFLDEYYLAFENKFRGSREAILKRYENYLNFINNDISSSLDIGCGRGEWVELLQRKGISSHGIDANQVMIEVGATHGVQNLQVADAFAYLKASPSNSFDLITAFHVIEHITYEKVIELLFYIKRVAKPNATILLETPNPQNLQVAAHYFYNDPTHLNPLPSEVIKFLVEYIGFVDVRVEFLNPMKQEKDLQISSKIERLLYSEQDYLVIAKNDK